MVTVTTDGNVPTGILVINTCMCKFFKLHIMIHNIETQIVLKKKLIRKILIITNLIKRLLIQFLFFLPNFNRNFNCSKNVCPRAIEEDFCSGTLEGILIPKTKDIAVSNLSHKFILRPDYIITLT